MNNAIANAQRQLDDARARLAALESFAPHVKCNPVRMIPHAGGIMVCYKLRDGAQLAELLTAHPPIPGFAYRGTFAGFKTADTYNSERERAKEEHEVCGVTFRIKDGGTVGKYPCDEAALSCNWYSDTPAGRVNVRVDFFYQDGLHWPRIAKTYKATEKRGNQSRIVDRWWPDRMPAGYQVDFRYRAFDNLHGGEVAFYFAADDHHDRDAFIANLTGGDA